MDFKIQTWLLDILQSIDEINLFLGDEEILSHIKRI